MKDEEDFDIVIQSKAKHGILWDLVQQFGTCKRLADELGVSKATLSAWLNLRTMPRLKLHDSKRKRRRTAKDTAMFLKLVQLTGRKIEDIFPGFVREKLHEIPRSSERRISVNLVAITDARHAGQYLPSPESPSPSPEETAVNHELKDIVRQLVATLPGLEKDIIELRFGLRNGRDMTLKECGEELSLSRERVRQIEMKALRKLQAFQRKRKLVSFIRGEDRET